MPQFSELLIVLFAASLPISYFLIIRHAIVKNEEEDLASLAKSGPLEPHECCCEIAARALEGKNEAAKAAAH